MGATSSIDESKLVIRKIDSIKDKQKVIDLEWSIFETELFKKCHIFDQEFLIGFVAEYKGKIIGFILGTYMGRNVNRDMAQYGKQIEKPTFFTIYGIGVLKKYRKKHIGSKLMTAFIEECYTYNIDQIYLQVRVSNKKAQKMYLKFGFNEACILKKYYHEHKKEDGIFMVKTLLEYTNGVTFHND